MKFMKEHAGIAIMFAVCAILITLVGSRTWPQSPSLPNLTYEQARNSNYKPGGSGCEEAYLAAIRNQRKAASQAEACQKEAEEHRIQTNDLIQQTRAANAAEAQAALGAQGLTLAFLQTLGGMVTLVAAVGAAIYARSAAIHTLQSNQILRSQHRPVLTITAFVNVEGGKMTTAFLLTNTRDFVAKSARVSVCWKVISVATNGCIYLPTGERLSGNFAGSAETDVPPSVTAKEIPPICVPVCKRPAGGRPFVLSAHVKVTYADEMSAKDAYVDEYRAYAIRIFENAADDGETHYGIPLVFHALTRGGKHDSLRIDMVGPDEHYRTNKGEPPCKQSWPTR